MTTSLSQRLEKIARDYVPIAITVFFTILSATPLYLPGYGMIAANLALMAIYYWAVYRPDLLSPLAAFCIGMIYDFLVGTPPGINALVFLLVRALVSRRGGALQGKPFITLWLGFVGISLSASLATWVISVIWHLTFLNPLPIVFQGGLTIGVFPFVCWLLVWTQHKTLSV